MAKIKFYFWLFVWLVLVVGGLILFYSLEPHFDGWYSFFYDIIGIAFPFVWIGSLYWIEQHFFKGAYERLKEEFRKQ